MTVARNSSWSENLRQSLTLSAFLGLLAGFGEGLLDLTHLHYHTPFILCVALLADLALSLALGLLLWLGGRIFRRKVHPALISFFIVWALLYEWFAAFSNPRVFGTLLAIASAVLALLISAFAWRRRESELRVARAGARWLGVLAVICLIAIPAADAWGEHRALANLPSISPNAPNVVFVIIDTLRADHLSVYGYDRPTSPEIDRLAKQGILFDTAISASSWTLPSHASMMTGTYPHVHHTDAISKQLPSGLTTLASTFERDGYRTAAFSANTYLFTRKQGFGRGFTHFGDFFQSPSDALAQVHYVHAFFHFLIKYRFRQNLFGRQTAADINRAALHWIGSGQRPFFLALNYLDVHDPYVPPQPWRHKFSKRMNPGGRINIGENILPKLSPAQIQDEMNAYDGSIAYADHELGLLVDALSRRGLLSNTLLVVTGDHGEAFGIHGLLDHYNALYFPLIHVPLLFRWPGHIPAGIRVRRPVSTKDIGATILALVHSRPNHFPGESLAGLWTGQANPDSWPPPISELAQSHFLRTFPNYYGPLSSVVTSDMQYIVDPRLGSLLYDWRTDPKETHNLYRDPRYQDVAATLAADLRESGARPLPPPNASSASPQARNEPRTAETPDSNGKHVRRP